ncbi:unnamed protein product [Caenorhabditis auriculariae]|uniref:Mitotic-spindle organizing protein 1 n=1 Tax=Caenorhabditis auriculariae TaxID=2777116 RepID=A0A8S1H9B9_9PELO|nr:unnamed protein product [Caenorhabditis auriculariae]
MSDDEAVKALSNVSSYLGVALTPSQIAAVHKVIEMGANPLALTRFLSEAEQKAKELDKKNSPSNRENEPKR